jgi:D-methionine transport system substrate-binding protein
VELVTFNDYVVPNEALNQGDVDVNAFQHLPYLEEQSRQRGYKLAVVGKTLLPIVAYSKKIKSVSELQPGQTIVILTTRPMADVHYCYYKSKVF